MTKFNGTYKAESSPGNGYCSLALDLTRLRPPAALRLSRAGDDRDSASDRD